jgi:hypothetical protein
MSTIALVVSVVSIVLTAVVGYWLHRRQAALQAELNTKLEQTKAELQAANAQEVAELQAAHASELSQLETTHTALLARTSRVREHEFAALNEIWQKLLRAQEAVAHLMAPLQDYPDVARLSDEQLRQSLEQLQFTSDERAAIAALTGPDRQEKYEEVLKRHQLAEAEAAHADYQHLLLENRLFLPPAVDRPAFETARLLRNALLRYRTGLEAHDRRLMAEPQLDTLPEIATLVDTVEQAMQEQLYPGA